MSSPPVALRARSIAASMKSLPLTRNSDFSSGFGSSLPSRSCSRRRGTLSMVFDACISDFIVFYDGDDAGVLMAERGAHLPGLKIEIFLAVGVDDGAALGAGEIGRRSNPPM